MKEYTQDEIEFARRYYEEDELASAVFETGSAIVETEDGPVQTVTRSAEKLIEAALGDIARGKPRARSGGQELYAVDWTTPQWGEIDAAQSAATFGRIGHTCILAPSTTVLVSADYGSGKSRLMSYVSYQLAIENKKTVWIISDMTAGQLKQMLLDAGFRDAAQIDQYVRVIDGPPGPGTAAAAAEYAGTWGDVALVVIDNLGKFGPRWLAGYKENDNTDANRFIDLCSGFKLHGACVAIMANTSHKTGANDSKVKYTRGASGYGDAADQVYFLAKKKPWGETTPGYSEIYCTKVRFGGFAENDYIGRFGYDGTGRYYTKAATETDASGTVNDVMAPDIKTALGRENFARLHWREQDPDNTGMIAAEVVGWLRNTAEFKGKTSAQVRNWVYQKTGILARGVESGWLLKVDAKEGTKYRYLAPEPPSATSRPDDSELLARLADPEPES